MAQRPINSPKPPFAPEPGLVRGSLIFYCLATAVGSAVMYWVHGNLLNSWAWPLKGQESFRFVAVAALAAFCLLTLSRLFEDFFPSYRALKVAIVQMLGGVSAATALLLALASAIGEEVLFRGALQPFAGLFITSLLFGLLHLGPSPKSAWSLWAALAGLLLGFMYEQTQSLWPPIMAHFVVNAVSLMSLRRSYQLMHAALNEAAKDGTGAAPMNTSDEHHQG